MLVSIPGKHPAPTFRARYPPSRSIPRSILDSPEGQSCTHVRNDRDDTATL